MRKFNNPTKDFAYLSYRWLSVVMDPVRLIKAPYVYSRFIGNLYKYSKMKSKEVRFINTYPLYDEEHHPFDNHYFYQDIWAARRIYKSRAKSHVDVGSNIEFAGFLTSFTKVKFVDIRQLKVQLANFEPVKGDILNLPFRDNSIQSLSCLHVAEHIGLGRYGDSLDPAGSKKACKELSRVLAKGGSLFFSLPVGTPRLCFNAHRIHSPKQITDYFGGLKLKELSGITDSGEFKENTDSSVLAKSDYACGLFWFTK